MWLETNIIFLKVGFYLWAKWKPKFAKSNLQVPKPYRKTWRDPKPMVCAFQNHVISLLKATSVGCSRKQSFDFIIQSASFKTTPRKTWTFKSPGHRWCWEVRTLDFLCVLCLAFISRLYLNKNVKRSESRTGLCL